MTLPVALQAVLSGAYPIDRQALGLIYLLLGLAADVAADVILRVRYRTSFRLDTPRKRALRVGRWGLVLGGMLILAASHVPPRFALPIALLSVSGATDAEHFRLPPSAYLYASVVISLVIAYGADGLPALIDALIAEAVMYATAIFAVVVLGATAGGDIKVAMQYGASSAGLAAAFNGIALATVGVLVPLGVVTLLVARRLPRYIPMASFLWAAAMIAVTLGGHFGVFAG